MGDLYLRCDKGNPGEVFWEIRGGGYDAGVFMKDGHTLDNLSIRFGLINYPFNNGTVQNCEICYDGGMECFDEENKLYLAGDGLCGEGRNNKVINCYAHDNMDNGIHIEYFSLYDGVYSDILFEGNLIENCGGGISIAYFAYTADEGQIFNNMICNDTIPDSVMHIGMYAFYGCSSLTSALIPDYTAVESSAFENCPNLTITRVK